MSLLVSCDGKLLISCDGKLLVSCPPPPPPRNICDWLDTAETPALDITVSGSVTCCTSCFNTDPFVGSPFGLRVDSCPSLVKAFTGVAEHDTPTFNNNLTLSSAYDEYGRWGYGSQVVCAAVVVWETDVLPVYLEWWRDGGDTIYILVYAWGIWNFDNYGYKAVLGFGYVNCADAVDGATVNLNMFDGSCGDNPSLLLDNTLLVVSASAPLVATIAIPA